MWFIEENIVQVQIINIKNNQELRFTTCYPGEASYWIACRRFRVIGYEVEYENVYTVFLENGVIGFPFAKHEIQIIVSPVLS
ncbi:TPA: hypothetical protein QCO66_005444 [Bacillus toyonensis]|uniref:hypothetical protein n=1 Tax=Bacillus toyonensis TaxID=155322 RepID=UPI00330B8D1F|nr:hypothetical protein [Bacillus toyonensis]HDR7408342.1 hypothetical protein [Bacillus toyonensis]